MGVQARETPGETEEALALGQPTLAQTIQPPSNLLCLVFILKYYKVCFHPGTAKVRRNTRWQVSSRVTPRPGPFTFLQRVLETNEIAEALNQYRQVFLRHWWLGSLNRKSQCLNPRGNWVQIPACLARLLSLGHILRSIPMKCRAVSTISSE